MLVDVQFRNPDEHINIILTLIAGDRAESIMPLRISQGIYLAGHWSLEHLLVGGENVLRKRWKELADAYHSGTISLLEVAAFDDFDEYGVCDNFEQPIEKWNLRERPENFFLAFVCLKKQDQEPHGGWRWHKWGPYIGTQDPQCEYLYDEPVIEQVFTYQIYELK